MKIIKSLTIRKSRKCRERSLLRWQAVDENVTINYVALKQIDDGAVVFEMIRGCESTNMLFANVCLTALVQISKTIFLKNGRVR